MTRQRGQQQRRPRKRQRWLCQRQRHQRLRKRHQRPCQQHQWQSGQVVRAMRRQQRRGHQGSIKRRPQWSCQVVSRALLTEYSLSLQPQRVFLVRQQRLGRQRGRSLPQSVAARPLQSRPQGSSSLPAQQRRQQLPTPPRRHHRSSSKASSKSSNRGEVRWQLPPQQLRRCPCPSH